MLLQRTAKTIRLLTIGLTLVAVFALLPVADTSASTKPTGGGSVTPVTPCGKNDKDGKGTEYTPSIELGCKNKGNAILDLTFAIIRFLSYGVGLVIVGSMTYAGIQYIGSRGEPNAHAQAIQRIQANVFALFLFIFAFAIVNYIIPGALLQ